ncbi:MAG TPA: xanthine dehydrogenase family protein subunit M [Rhodothermales bacterium]|nr:xanthine dehydrogenase family protein subunit M [Rhodothermales bacterium]
MKPPPFDYHAPETTAEALTLLAKYGYDASILAGGQSLVPTMNFRLAQPTVLIDINRIPDLAFIRSAEDGGLHIGAMTRHRSAELSPLVAEHAPLLHETMPFIAHPPIRNRGTLGGSIAHADPAAELPAVMLALNAQFRLQSQRGERWIAARDFFIGLFATAREPDELLTEIALAPLLPRTGCAFREVARRHGDYALVGAAAVVALDAQGRCEHARLTLLSVGEGPVDVHAVYHLLSEEMPSADVLRAASEAAARDIDPPADIHASAAYRRHLTRVLSEDVLTRATARARGSH